MTNIRDMADAEFGLLVKVQKQGFLKYLINEDHLIVIAQSIVDDIEILQLIMKTSYNI